MFRAARDVDQIARGNFDGEHRPVVGMDMKHAATSDGETHFVFSMRVFFVELGQHGIEVRGVRLDVDHVGGHKTTANFERFDFGCELGQDLFVGSILGQTLFDWPVLVPYSKWSQELADLSHIGQRAILVGNYNSSHSFHTPCARDCPNFLSSNLSSAWTEDYRTKISHS